MALKGADEWSFDVFKLNDTCKGQVLKFLSADLLNRYGLIHKFKVFNHLSVLKGCAKGSPLSSIIFN